MRITLTLAAIAGSFLVAGCASNDIEGIAPYQTKAGRLGFTVQGLAQFTDQTALEARMRLVLTEACKGDIENVDLTYTDASSRAGVPHTAYRGKADCKR